MKHSSSHGYTLVELMVAVGLFAIIMVLSAGAYFVMIGLNRQVQSITTGIDNLSFALETMTRTIRTSTNYSCDGGGDCNGGTTFSVRNSGSVTVSYRLSNGVIIQTKNGIDAVLTDPSVVISSMYFFASGTSRVDTLQPRVTVIVSGTVSSGPGKTEPFTIETGATMRGTDI